MTKVACSSVPSLSSENRLQASLLQACSGPRGGEMRNIKIGSGGGGGVGGGGGGGGGGGMHGP